MGSERGVGRMHAGKGFGDMVYVLRQLPLQLRSDLLVGQSFNLRTPFIQQVGPSGGSIHLRQLGN